MKLILISILLFAFTCQTPGPKITQPPMDTKNTIMMKQNTVATLEGVRIGNGNYMTRTFELPDGSTKEGLSARLFFPDDSNLVVGVGSVFKVKEKQYEVLEILMKYKDKSYGIVRIQEIE